MRASSRVTYSRSENQSDVKCSPPVAVGVVYRERRFSFFSFPLVVDYTRRGTAGGRYFAAGVEEKDYWVVMIILCCGYTRRNVSCKLPIF